MISATVEKMITEREVISALKYSFRNGKINHKKLEEYQKYYAEDGRYRFYIWGICKRLNMILIQYKGEKYICHKQDKCIIERVD
jgi:hypothetical protein